MPFAAQPSIKGLDPPLLLRIQYLGRAVSASVPVCLVNADFVTLSISIPIAWSNSCVWLKRPVLLLLDT